MSETVDVFVSGAGPVGLFFTYQMAMRGHNVYCVDTKPQPTNQSRALLVTTRTMEILENKGMAADVLYSSRIACGLRLFSNGSEVGQIHSYGDTPYPHVIVLNQGKTEEIIYNRIKERTNYDIHWEHELISYTQDEDGVTSVVRDMKTNKEKTIRSKYIVGADGSHSRVRKNNPEWTYDGVAIETKLILADLNLHGDNIDQLMDRMNAFIKGSYVMGMVRMNPMGDVDNHSNLFRIFCNMGVYKINKDQTRVSHGKQEEEALNIEELQEWMNNITAPQKFIISDLVWASYFRINERMANGFRKGKAFLIGDSAHCHSPAGGQGMNLGLQDADNLAWKMSDVLNGIASDPEKLLDSFGEEQFVAIDTNASKIIGKSDSGLIKEGTFLPETDILRKTFILPQKHLPDRIQRNTLRGILIHGTQYTVIFVGTCLPHYLPNKDLIGKFWQDTRGLPIRRLVIQSTWHTFQSNEFPKYIQENEYNEAENSFYGEERMDVPTSVTQRIGLHPLLTSFFGSDKTASVLLFIRPDLYISHAKIVKNEADLTSALTHLSTLYK